MEHEHELVDMQVLQFEKFYGKPNLNKRRSKVCNTYIDKLIYAPRGLFLKIRQCNCIKILNEIFLLRLLCQYLMMRIMKVLFKGFSMAT
jgi:hypothetical protein